MMEVRRLRQARGWNQTELAYHSGLAPSVISQIENGKRDPSAGTLKKLARALEVDVADLFLKKGQAPLFPRSPRSETSELRREERAWEILLEQEAARGEEVAEEIRSAEDTPVGAVAKFGAAAGHLLFLYGLAGGAQGSSRLEQAEEKLRMAFAEVDRLAEQLFDPLDPEQASESARFRARRRHGQVVREADESSQEEEPQPNAF